MTDRGAQLLRGIQANLVLLAEHDKLHPDEVDSIVRGIGEHLRSWKPAAMSPILIDTVPYPKGAARCASMSSTGEQCEHEAGHAEHAGLHGTIDGEVLWRSKAAT